MRVGLSLLCYLVPFVAASGVGQQPVNSNRINIVDRLGSDPDFTLLLRLLQRARLIPTLNRLGDATFFAPTNEAIERYRNSTSSAARLWATLDFGNVDALDPPDNMQYKLRQHLLYHLLNYSIPIMPPDFPNQPPLALDTLHYPDVAYLPPTDEPAPAPPWLPAPGGSLNNAPQRLRVASRGAAAWIGVDSAARGGAQVVKDPLLASNGIIVPVGDVVSLPDHLYGEIIKHPYLQEFASILTPEMIDSLSKSPHLTLFLPIDSAWSTLDSIERKYLHSGYAQRDVSRLVGLHSSGAGVNSTGDVGWSDTWDDGMTFTTADGQILTIGFSANGSIQVSQSTVVQEDIYAANGVLHIVSNLLIAPDTFQINAEKYLLALNATTFVGLLRTAHLSHYVDNEHDGKTWTILAPRDDIIAAPWSHRDDNSELDRVLRYHFIPGKLSTNDLIDGALLGTELREGGLDGGRQRLRVSVTHDDRVEPDANGEVGFGSARVIADPVETASFLIYLISQILQPPGNAIEKIETSAKLSTFLSAAYASSMSHKLQSEHSTTLIVPHNNGFERLSLLTDYLLLPDDDSRRDLKRVIKNHMLQGLYYTSDLGDDTTRNISTREGAPIIIDHALKVRESGVWNRTSVLIPRDDLTQTGVIHEVKDVLLPSTLRVNVGDLARAAGGNTMITLIHRAGLGGLLNGTLTLEDVDGLDDWKRTHRRNKTSHFASPNESNPSIGWTLLCPKDSAFNSVNLTRLLNDVEALRSLVMQHIIPVTPIMAPSSLDPELPLSYADEATYATLLSPNSLRADLVFRVTGKPAAPLPISQILVGIKGARGSDGLTDFARVVGYGRTTIPARGAEDDPTRDARSGVLQIDHVLQPWIPDWWNAWGKAVAGGIIGGVLIVVFWATVLYFWRRRDEEPTYEPLNGAITGEDDYE